MSEENKVPFDEAAEDDTVEGHRAKGIGRFDGDDQSPQGDVGLKTRGY